jgi:hypothetical protein
MNKDNNDINVPIIPDWKIFSKMTELERKNLKEEVLLYHHYQSAQNSILDAIPKLEKELLRVESKIRLNQMIKKWLIVAIVIFLFILVVLLFSNF